MIDSEALDFFLAGGPAVRMERHREASRNFAREKLTDTFLQRLDYFIQDPALQKNIFIDGLPVDVRKREVDCDWCRRFN